MDERAAPAPPPSSSLVSAPPPPPGAGGTLRGERVAAFGIDAGDGVRFDPGTWAPGVQATRVLTLRNVTAATLHVRVKLPRSKHFVVPFPDVLTLAPGLPAHVVVTFRPVAAEDVDDAIEVACDSGSFWVPLTARVARLAASLSHGALDFGGVPVSQATTRDVLVRNDGAVDAVFAWTAPPPFAVEPAAGAVSAGGVVRCAVTVAPRAAGALATAATVAVAPAGGAGGASGLELRLSLAARAFFAHVAVDAPTLDFGAVSAPAHRALVVRNVGPVWTAVTVAVADGGVGIVTGGGVPPSSPFTATPTALALQPGEAAAVSVAFTPRTRSLAGTAASATVAAPGGNAVRVTLAGSLPPPVVTLERKARGGAPPPARPGGARFADTRVGERATHVLVLRNHSPAAVAFDVDALSETAVGGRGGVSGGALTVSPARGVLPPATAVQLVLTFAPHAPGNYHRRVLVLLGSGASPVALDAVGTAVGVGLGSADTRPFPLKQCHVDAYRARPRHLRLAAPADVLAAAAAGAGVDDTAVAAGAELALTRTPGPSGDRSRAGAALLASLWAERWLTGLSGAARAPPVLAGLVTPASALLGFADGEARALVLRNHAAFVVTAVWAPAPPGQPWHVVPAAATLQPGGDAAFTVTYGEGGGGGGDGGGDRVPPLPPGGVPPSACVLEATVAPAVNRSFRLVDEGALTPPLCVPVLVTGVRRGGSGGGSVPRLATSFGGPLPLVVGGGGADRAAGARPSQELVLPPAVRGEAVFATFALHNAGDAAVAWLLRVPPPTCVGGGGRSGAEPLLSVYPPAGVVRGGEQCIVVVRFAPPTRGADATAPVQQALRVPLHLLVDGGAAPAATVAVVAVADEPRLRLECDDDAAVDAAGAGAGATLFVKPTCVGVASSRTLTVANPSAVPVRFEWRVPRAARAVLRVRPASGDLPPGGRARVEVTFAPRVSGAVRVDVPCYAYPVTGSTVDARVLLVRDTATARSSAAAQRLQRRARAGGTGGGGDGGSDDSDGDGAAPRFDGADLSERADADRVEARLHSLRRGSVVSIGGDGDGAAGGALADESVGGLEVAACVAAAATAAAATAADSLAAAAPAAAAVVAATDDIRDGGAPFDRGDVAPAPRAEGLPLQRATLTVVSEGTTGALRFRAGVAWLGTTTLLLRDPSGAGVAATDGAAVAMMTTATFTSTPAPAGVRPRGHAMLELENVSDCSLAFALDAIVQVQLGGGALRLASRRPRRGADDAGRGDAAGGDDLEADASSGDSDTEVDLRAGVPAATADRVWATQPWAAVVAAGGGARSAACDWDAGTHGAPRGGRFTRTLRATTESGDLAFAGREPGAGDERRPLFALEPARGIVPAHSRLRVRARFTPPAPGAYTFHVHLASGADGDAGGARESRIVAERAAWTVEDDVRDPAFAAAERLCIADDGGGRGASGAAACSVTGSAALPSVFVEDARAVTSDAALRALFPAHCAGRHNAWAPEVEVMRTRATAGTRGPASRLARRRSFLLSTAWDGSVVAGESVASGSAAAVASAPPAAPTVGASPMAAAPLTTTTTTTSRAGGRSRSTARDRRPPPGAAKGATTSPGAETQGGATATAAAAPSAAGPRDPVTAHAVLVPVLPADRVVDWSFRLPSEAAWGDDAAVFPRSALCASLRDSDDDGRGSVLLGGGGGLGSLPADDGDDAVLRLQPALRSRAESPWEVPARSRAPGAPAASAQRHSVRVAAAPAGADAPPPPVSPADLWQRLSLRALNARLASPVLAPCEAAFNAATSVVRDVSTLPRAIPLDFPSAPMDAPPEVLLLSVRNPSPALAAVVTFTFPDAGDRGDVDAGRGEAWEDAAEAAAAADGASDVAPPGTQQRGVDRDLLRRGLLGVVPRVLRLPPGAAGLVRLHYAHAAPGRHAVRLLMHVHGGGVPVLLQLRGHTVHAGDAVLDAGAPQGRLRLAAVALGGDRAGAPLQAVPLHNPTDTAVEYDADVCGPDAEGWGAAISVPAAARRGNVGPRTTVAIPVRFAPAEARAHAAELRVTVRAAGGGSGAGSDGDGGLAALHVGSDMRSSDGGSAAERTLVAGAVPSVTRVRLHGRGYVSAAREGRTGVDGAVQPALLDVPPLASLAHAPAVALSDDAAPAGAARDALRDAAIVIGTAGAGAPLPLSENEGVPAEAAEAAEDALRAVALLKSLQGGAEDIAELPVTARASTVIADDGEAPSLAHRLLALLSARLDAAPPVGAAKRQRPASTPALVCRPGDAPPAFLGAHPPLRRTAFLPRADLPEGYPVALSTEWVRFGDTPCGGAVAHRIVVLRNDRPRGAVGSDDGATGAIDFAVAAAPGGGAVTVEPSAGRVEPGGAVLLRVTLHTPAAPQLVDARLRIVVSVASAEAAALAAAAAARELAIARRSIAGSTTARFRARRPSLEVPSGRGDSVDGEPRLPVAERTTVAREAKARSTARAAAVQASSRALRAASLSRHLSSAHASRAGSVTGGGGGGPPATPAVGTGRWDGGSVTSVPVPVPVATTPVSPMRALAASRGGARAGSVGSLPPEDLLQPLPLPTARSGITDWGATIGGATGRGSVRLGMGVGSLPSAAGGFAAWAAAGGAARRASAASASALLQAPPPTAPPPHVVLHLRVSARACPRTTFAAEHSAAALAAFPVRLPAPTGIEGQRATPPALPADGSLCGDGAPLRDGAPAVVPGGSRRIARRPSSVVLDAASAASAAPPPLPPAALARVVDDALAAALDDAEVAFVGARARDGVTLLQRVGAPVGIADLRNAGFDAAAARRLAAARGPEPPPTPLSAAVAAAATTWVSAAVDAALGAALAIV